MGRGHQRFAAPAQKDPASLRSSTMQIAQIAELLNGRLIGDGSRFCAGANPPELASASEITMLDDPKRAQCLASTQAIAVITPVPLQSGQLNIASCAQIIVEHPHDAFADRK